MCQPAKQMSKMGRVRVNITWLQWQLWPLCDYTPGYSTAIYLGPVQVVIFHRKMTELWKSRDKGR